MKFCTLKEASTAEIVEKKSRFIANSYHIESKEEAEEKINLIKKKYYDAKHNCFAFSIVDKDGNLLEKSSDDGEPSGTAGAPILNVIRKNNLNNVLIVVTRYFGGILLGTGGLTRAYSNTALASIENRKIIEVENGLQASLEIEYSENEKFKYYCGDGADMLVRRCLEDAGDPQLDHYEEARKMYRERFDQDPLYKVSVYPHMMEALNALKEAGVKIAVCSNKPHVASVKVVEELFGDLFDVVIGQNSQIRRKPAPDEPLKAAQIMNVKPEECMYFGDTGTDMQTGKAAGMLTVGVLWGYRTKDELIANGADLLLETPKDIWKIYREKKDD